MKLFKFLSLLYFCISISINAFATLSSPTLAYPINGSQSNYSQFTIGLSAISGITKYRFQADTSKNFNSPVRMDSIRKDANYFASTKFPYGSTVYVRCKVYSATDSSIWSTAVTISISDKIKLSLPTNGTNGIVNYLQWINIGQAEYQVMIDTSPNFNSALVSFRSYKNLTSSRITPDSFYFGKKYYWKVRAIDNTDTLKWSDVWSYTFQTASKITFPAAATNYMGRSSSMHIFWDNAGMAKVRYQISADPSFTKIVRDHVVTEYGNNYDTAFFLDYATTYYCRLKFFSKIDSLPWAVGGTYRTLEPRIINPYNGIVIDYPGVTLGLFGDNGNVIDTFQLQIDTNSNFKNPIVDSFTTNFNVFFNKTRLNTIYYTRVRGLHYKDTSVWSAVRTFRTTDVNYYGLYTIPQNGETNTDLKFTMQWSGLINKIPYLELDLDTNASFSSPQHQIFKGAYSTPNNFLLSNLLFNTKYYFRFKIGDNYDTSVWSTIRSFTTASGTLVYDYPPNTARNWNIQNNLLIKNPTVDGIKYYLWELDTTPLFNSPIIRSKLDTAILTFEPQGYFYLGREYYWRVAAAHDKDTAAWGPTWNYQTHTTYLNKPLNGAIDQNTSVTFAWGGHSDLKGYFLLLDTSSLLKANPIKIADGFQQTTTINNLLNGKTYYWTILPYNEIDTGSAYTVYHFTVKTLAALTVPQLYLPANNAINVNYASVYFSWQSFNETGILYNVQISNSSSFATLLYDQNQSTTSTSIAGFVDNSSYYWRVRFKRGSSDTGPWSNTYKFTTKVKPNSIEGQLPQGFEIYPNPVKNELMVNATKDASMSIYNSSGQLISNLMLKSGLNPIQFSEMATGNYFLHINIGDKVYIKKVVKE